MNQGRKVYFINAGGISDNKLTISSSAKGLLRNKDLNLVKDKLKERDIVLCPSGKNKYRCAEIKSEYRLEEGKGQVKCIRDVQSHINVKKRELGEGDLQTGEITGDPAQKVIQKIEIKWSSSLSEKKGSPSRIADIPEGKRPEISSQRLILEEVGLKKFKAIKEFNADLSDVTILVGDNASGKSSVLQGLHLLGRAASFIHEGSFQTGISYTKLDYLPSTDLPALLHKGRLKNQNNSKDEETISGKFKFEGQQYFVEFWLYAREGGITVKVDERKSTEQVRKLFLTRETYSTAYIPGITAISNNESLLPLPTLRRRAASGEASGVLRNILWRIKEKDGDLRKVEKILSDIFGKIELHIKFDEQEDEYLRASFFRGGKDGADEESGGLEKRWEPLETMATGILKVLQILVYQFYFNPKLLLVDEPDANLHPEHRRVLMGVLEDLAIENKTRIILTTHDPFLVKARSFETKLVWLKEGEVRSEASKEIEKLLGFGALTKEILLYTEDADTKALEALLKQWPEIERKIGIIRVHGVDALPKFTAAKAEAKTLDKKILILRDRDFMVDNEGEVQRWHKEYTDESAGVIGLTTEKNDIESYFLDIPYLSKLLSLSEEEVKEKLREAKEKLNNDKKLSPYHWTNSKPSENFKTKRDQHSKKFKTGDYAPAADNVLWKEFVAADDYIVGKKLHEKLIKVFQGEPERQKRLSSFGIPSGIGLAPDLKKALEKLMSQGQEGH